MRMRVFAASAIFVFILSVAGCLFGPSKFKGVMSYRNGRVYLKKDSFYRVGDLPDGWRLMKTRVRTVSFYNGELGASISTDAFCGSSVEGRRIDSLSGELISALEKREVLGEKEFELDGRGAVRQLVRGEMDGMPVLLDLVVVRKNGCVFDFYSITPGASADSKLGMAFDAFFKSFHYE